MVPSRAEWRGETDNRATTPVSYCPSTASFSVRPYCKNARRDRCQEYHNCFPFGELEETISRPRTTWMKTIQQDLRYNNLSLDEAITVAQNRPHWRLMSAFGATHPSGACHTRRRRSIWMLALQHKIYQLRNHIQWPVWQRCHETAHRPHRPRQIQVLGIGKICLVWCILLISIKKRNRLRFSCISDLHFVTFAAYLV